jgi:cytoskeletal protein CcmA (bactofilin family)
LSIFRRESSVAPAAPNRPVPAESSRDPRDLRDASPANATVIARGTRLEGAVTGATALRIEGELAGEVRITATVTLGADGVLEGPVSARSVFVAGRLTGDVKATERVEIAATGSLEGNVTTPRFVTAEGAFFKGRVEMAHERESADASKNPESRRAKPAAEAKKAASEKGGN